MKPLSFLFALSTFVVISMALADDSAKSAPMSAPNPSVNGLPPPASLSTAAIGAAPVAPVAIDYKKFRDPFKEPAISEVQELRSELERYAVTDFKVVAVITGPLRMRAMLIAPDNKTHYVSEKMKIGLRDGVIVKITTKSVVVREKVVNPLGEVELFDTEISMDQPAVAGNTPQ
jgi:hypothetical protein